MAVQNEYVEERNGGYYVAGTRTSLDSIVIAFSEGLSPEAIHDDFPVLKLSQIYGAIAFYLDHQAEIDKYLKVSAAEFEGQSAPLAEENSSLWGRLQRARAAIGHSRG